ncbi:hypothetical protein Pth03_07860 [Planotetraspora thailandica]|uniref:DUF7779 domain-containing protein n=1 Tax=Planotetraspora thailandica TaxID=487172 RepID=A0A8J3UVZ0_9ACTN|nr:FxSxx-COOH system tetratricopeptide repeat protein [Planotetraspora thailandica]GII52397.1 hypothetical protein Pth03_07860 [Planotetraspora thailandica]
MEPYSQVANSVPAREPAIWEGVPSRNPNFTGRDELLVQLRQSMNTVTAVVAQPQTLQGLGGVGKTQLAIEYAWQYRSHYDLVWWISAEQHMLVPSSLAGLARPLGLPSVAATGVEQATQNVLRALQSGVPYRRWLVIFDNAEEPDFILKLIPRGPGHVLITSRNSSWSDHESTIEVDVFSRVESVAFLRKRLGREVEDSEAEQLAEKLGDLPLALEQAGALQRQTAMSVDEYVDLLDKQTNRLLNLNKPASYPQSMTAAWRLSVSQLEDRLPEAVDLLRCCAFFGPEPIPRDVFRRGNKVVGPRLGKILADPILLTTALSTLERFALVKVEPSSRTLQVHRLNQALLRDELSPQEREELRHEVHQLLAGSAPADPDDPAMWPRFEGLAAHVGPSGLVESTDPNVRAFALNVVRYLYVSGNYRSAFTLVQELIEEWTRASGALHLDVLVARKHLGNIHRELTEYGKAYEVTRETLDLMGEVLGPDHSETLWTSASYGATLRARGEFLPARQLDEQLVETIGQTFGDDRLRVLRAKNNLALDYALTSAYDQSRDLLQEVYLDLSDAAVRVPQTTLLRTWNNMARAVRLSGQPAEACDLGTDICAYGRAELGLENIDTLLALKDLSVALRRTGKVEDSLKQASDAHSRLQRLFGDDHADTMAAAMTLSNVLRAAGQLDEAFGIAQQTVLRYPAVFGADHPFTHACNVDLALLHRLRGEVAVAREIDEKALAGLSERVSRSHDYSLTCAINLQNDLALLGEAEKARELGEQTYRHAQVYFSPDHFISLACANNLSHDLRATGDEEEAKRLHAETIERYERALGPEHPDAVLALRGERVNTDFDPPPI